MVGKEISSSFPAQPLLAGAGFDAVVAGLFATIEANGSSAWKLFVGALLCPRLANKF